MKNYYRVFCFLISVTFGLWAMTSYASEVQAMKPYTDPGKPILVTKSKSKFTIELPSNVTTGYSWFLVRYNDELLKPISHEYIKPKEEKPGAGGVEQWTFKVDGDAFKVPQLTRIKLIYAQPWNLRDAKRVTFTIVAK